MTTVRAQMWMILGTLALGPLAAAGCTNRQPFDMTVVHRGTGSVGFTQPREGTGGLIMVAVVPDEDGGCYEVPADLRITANGVPATSIELSEELVSGGPASPCGPSEHTILRATFVMADPTQPVTIDIAQGDDHAAMEVQPLPRPPLTLTSIGPLRGSADGSYASAELVPLTGDPSDVVSGIGCWEAWLCPPGSDTNCASHSALDVMTVPSPTGARLNLRFFNEPPGDRSLWVSGSAAPNCGAPAVSACSGFVACRAVSNNHEYLLGPYPFQVY